MRKMGLTILELKMAFWGRLCLRAGRYNLVVFNFCIKKIIHTYGKMIDKYKDLLIEYMDKQRLERIVDGMDVVLDYYYTNVLRLGEEVHDGNH